MTTHAKLNFDESGTPVSTQFDDIYFSKQDGLAETRYVFLEQNQLQTQLEQLDVESTPVFHIGETGFGTGLNFLATWELINQINEQRAAHNATTSPIKLKFTSFEKYPLTKIDLQKALLHWPALSDLATLLLAQYPDTFELNQAVPQSNNSTIVTLQLNEGLVELNLVIGDVNEQMPTLLNHYPKINAWFLDGFAPSKNPDMWTPGLFSNIAALSSNHATLATFTAAGLVRRGLIEVGFDVKKVKGFGRKREMLAAIYTG